MAARCINNTKFLVKASVRSTLYVIISFLFINSLHAQRYQSFKEFNTDIAVGDGI